MKILSYIVAIIMLSACSSPSPASLLDLLTSSPTKTTWKMKFKDQVYNNPEQELLVKLNVKLVFSKNCDFAEVWIMGHYHEDVIVNEINKNVITLIPKGYKQPAIKISLINDEVHFYWLEYDQNPMGVLKRSD